MKEQVPELEKKVAEWVGFEKFQRYRGKLGKLEDFLKAIFFDEKFCFYSETVSSFKRNCEGILGPDLTVLCVKIIQLIRNGQIEFAQEVMRALYRQDYSLPGEISPGKFVPYTVVMLEPWRVVAAIRWILGSVFCEELVYYYQPEKRCHDRPLSPLNQEIHEAFPSLWKFVKAAEKDILLHGHNDFIRLAYAEDVLCKYIPQVVKLYEIGGRGLHLNHSYQDASWVDSFSSDNQGVYSRLLWASGNADISSDVLHFSQYLAFVVKGEQREVRAMFPRKADVATWQLRVPESNFSDLGKFRVGIHEETLRSKWERQQPMFVSKGDPHFGLSAIGLPNVYGEVQAEYCSYSRDNISHKHGHELPFSVLFDPSEREFQAERRYPDVQL